MLERAPVISGSIQQQLAQVSTTSGDAAAATAAAAPAAKPPMMKEFQVYRCARAQMPAARVGTTRCQRSDAGTVYVPHLHACRGAYLLLAQRQGGAAAGSGRAPPSAAVLRWLWGRAGGALLPLGPTPPCAAPVGAQVGP